MRKKLFEKNYKLLNVFIPEILAATAPDYWLDHVSTDNCYKNASALRLNENTVTIGTFYKHDGVTGTVSDPSMDILFDNKKQIARVTAMSMDNFGMCWMGTAFWEEYDCTIDSKETDKEIEANDYLGSWLKLFAEARKNDKNYFTKKIIKI